MEHKWTDEQWQAITVRDCNLLVSAAAGAGKTAVLVERIIHLLNYAEKPLDIDRLLVVTFTEAAAAEMRERIGKALQNEMIVSSRPELARQLALLNGAAISTLHAFCLDVIRRYFYLLDLDPGFRIADELEATLLQQSVLADVLEEAFQEGEKGFLALVSRFGGKNSDESLIELILRIYRFAWSNPWPERWLINAAQPYLTTGAAPEAALWHWLEPVTKQLQLSLTAADSALCRALRLLNLPGAPLVYEGNLVAEREQIAKLQMLLYGSWAELREAWSGIQFKRLPEAKGAEEELKEEIKELRDRAKTELKDCLVMYLTRSIEEYYEEVKILGPVIHAMNGLVIRFAQYYGAAKKARGLLDFNDLEHNCLSILLSGETFDEMLTPSAAANELRSRYEHVLVDEYQDINPVQEAILHLVSRQGEPAPNLFMVGDVKQSIYRFRLGDPGLFMERFERYPETGGGTERRLLLSYNFRCRSGVVNAVNFIFRQLMTREAAEIEYDRAAELACGAQYPEAGENCMNETPVEVYLLERNNERPQGEGMPDWAEAGVTALEKEGAIIARRISQMVDTGSNGATRVYDKTADVYRPLMYRDIVILMRATTGRANQLVELLGKYGIPAYADLSTGYFAATEVDTMLSFLKIVDNPCQDIPLAAVLRSPFVGLNEEQLAAVRLYGGKGCDFYGAARTAALGGLPGISKRLRYFFRRLDDWREKVRHEKLAAFIAAVYKESGYRDYVAGLPDGAQRQANLRALFERARQFDRFSRQGLFRFLQFIEQLRASGKDLGAARALGEKENVVRILSVHKAKGLEFPVVFLCDLGKDFNVQDTRDDVLLHRQLGLGPLIVEPEKRLRYPSLPYLALRLRTEAETRAEEMRILYVALTRAREKLVLIGSVRNLPKEIKKWSRLLNHTEQTLPADEIADAKSYLDWLGKALVRHPDMFGKDTAQLSWLTGEESRFALEITEDSAADAKTEIAEHRRVQQIGNDLLSMLPVSCDVPADLEEAVRERINFRYQYPVSTLPAKLSVSEIKRRFDHREKEEDGTINYQSTQLWSSPAFIAQKKGLSAADKGTLYHLVLQFLDFHGSLDPEGIRQQIYELAVTKIIPAATAGEIDPGLITAFLQSEAGKVLLAHKGTIHREWPFTMSLPIHEINPELPADTDEYIVTQGIIDVIIATPSGYVLIDYKTDQIPAGGISELTTRYRTQMDLYKRAVEVILKKPVQSTYIYFLHAKCTVLLDKDTNINQ
ncbi:MAG: helicase-exonuclease AddAB subunit AddA [Clostridiales bacterium]|nr:helicase-exonuclease AddAB subunit AddA [Clostridiales bacterium]